MMHPISAASFWVLHKMEVTAYVWNSDNPLDNNTKNCPKKYGMTTQARIAKIC